MNFDMDEFLDKYLNTSYIITSKEYEELFEKLIIEVNRKDNKKGSIEGRYMISLGENVHKRLSMSSAYENYPEDDILMLLEHRYKNIIEKDKLKSIKTKMGIIFQPSFQIIRADLIKLTSLGYNKTFKFVFENINLNCFDLDRATLGIAVQNGNNEIVNWICDWVNKKENNWDIEDSYISDKIINKINKDIKNLDEKTMNKIIDTFEWCDTVVK